MSYAAAKAYEGEAARLGVSTVARSSKGFMREYQKAGSSAAMRKRPLPGGVTGGATWGQKRDAFIARHMQQYRKNPTYRRFPGFSDVGVQTPWRGALEERQAPKPQPLKQKKITCRFVPCSCKPRTAARSSSSAPCGCASPLSLAF